MPPSHITRLRVEGNFDSPVRVVYYEDLACKDCATWRTMLDDILLPRFSEGVGFESRDFPLEKHPWAMPAAAFARQLATIDADHGFNFRRYCYQHIAGITVENISEHAKDFAESAGLGPLANAESEFRLDIIADRSAGESWGVEKTPTVFVGELRFIELFGVEEVVAAINKELGKGDSQA